MGCSLRRTCLTSNDLEARELILLLFSEGVDNIVDGQWGVCHQDSPRKDEPSTVGGTLLAEKVTKYIVSCRIEPKQLGEEAGEVLDNLLAGTDVRDSSTLWVPPFGQSLHRCCRSSRFPVAQSNTTV